MLLCYPATVFEVTYYVVCSRVLSELCRHLYFILVTICFVNFCNPTESHVGTRWVFKG